MKKLLTVLALAAPLFASAQVTTTLLNDDLSTSTNWFNSSASGTSLSGGALSVTAGRHVLAFFAPAGSPRTLADGESIEATLTLTYNSVGTGSGGFRVGMFDSNGTVEAPQRPTAAGQANLFTNYDGYVFTWGPNPGAGSNALTLRERENPASLDTLMASTGAGTYTAVGSGGGPVGQVFQTATPYALNYTVSREANSLVFSLTITGGSLSGFTNTFTVASPSTYEFDSFGLLSISTNGSNFSIDDVLITHTAIPEPSTYAAIVGALALAFVWSRRRHRRA